MILFYLFLINIFINYTFSFVISNKIDIFPWEKEISALEGTCFTQACIQASNTLKMSINTSVDPCDDFYQFSCGGWIKNHPIPPTESHWNQFNIIEEKLDHELHEILTEAIDENDLLPINLAKNMYSSCMDEEYQETKGIKELSGLLNEYGGWPLASSKWNEEEFSWQNVVASITRRFAITPLLSVYVYLDRKDSSRSVITVDQSSFILPRTMLSEPEKYNEILGAYALWIAKNAHEISKANKQRVSRAEMILEAHELLGFEIQLAKITTASEVRRDAYRMYNPMSIKQLQKWTNAASKSDSQIDWYSFLLDLFIDTDIKLSAGERLIIREVDYILKLVKLIEKTPKRTIANYIIWRLLQYFCRDINQKFRDITFEFEQVYSGVQEDQLRWRECVTRTTNSLPFAVGYKYVQKNFDDNAKQTALLMVDNIRSAFKTRILQSDWMDDETKEAAIQKAEAMSQFIGFPDWYQNSSAILDYYKGLQIGKSHLNNIEETLSFQIRKVFNKLRKPTDRSEWISGPAVVNAYYNPYINSIVFPAGILQTPFFAKDRIEALNYGSIGVIIGHEITHGFDDMGRQIDKYGNLVQWWSENTIKSYIDLKQCFINEYNSFKVIELNEKLGDDAKVNGIVTQGENIADNGGLRQAFYAYQNYIEKHGPELKLPELDYTPDQLFFLGFSTIWCESNTKESLLNEIISESHAPHRFRVIGSIMNTPEFSKVWNCPNNSPMNSNQKCNIY